MCLLVKWKRVCKLYFLATWSLSSKKGIIYFFPFECKGNRQQGTVQMGDLACCFYKRLLCIKDGVVNTE